MMVFDVDGTLIGGEAADWASFGGAFEEVAGFTLDLPFFARIEEITAQAIVHQALENFPYPKRKQMETAVRDAYLRRLKRAHELDATSFPALEGTLALLEELKQRGMRVAIATGDWLETITFKLSAAGIPFDDIPMVTSSDLYSRADIVTAAVAKAGGLLEEAVYIGDGLWDYRACQKLGIPFIGVGRRKEKLQNAGAAFTLADLSPVAFWQMAEMIRKPNPQVAR